MLNSCCVVNCKNSQHNKSAKYLTIPVLRKHKGPKAKAISKQRIQQLLQTINQKDFTEKSIKSKKCLTVCSDHLVSGQLCPKLEGDKVKSCAVYEHICNKAINRLLPVPADQSCGTLQTEVTTVENQVPADNIFDNVEMECTISSQNNDELNYDTFRKEEHEYSNNSPSPNESFLLRSIDDLTTQCSAPTEQPYPVSIFRVDQEARSDSCDTHNDQLDFDYAKEDAECSEHNYCKRLYTSLLEEFNNIDTAGQHSTSDQISIKEEYFSETVNAENVSMLKQNGSCFADLEIKEEPTSDTECQTTDLPEVKIEVVDEEMWEENMNQRPSEIGNGGLYLTEVTEALSEELRNFNVLNLMLSAGFL